MTASKTAAVLWDAIGLDNHFVSHTLGDPSVEVRPRQVHRAMYSRVAPTPVSAPKLLAYAPAVAEQLSLPRALFEDAAEDAAAILSGNRLLDGSEPFAAAYGGHQFGHWAGQLGDGRAISLGERIGRDGGRYEMQLKGAGPTPYSRSADGRAVLRSSVREYLMSEAMFHLGVPTTRALSLVVTGDAVVRDMLYDGHPAPEPGAIVCRVAPSFLRFGNFQLFSARDDVDSLRLLTDYAVETHFPEIAAKFERGADRVLAFLAEVTKRTAITVSEWMRVGFVHGVMNTDNLSILGLTIDYGPYGWVDNFDPTWTPNTTDAQHRRYRFGAQPQVALWNLARFAEALLPLVGKGKAASEKAKEALAVYAEVYESKQDQMWAQKLGLQAAPIPLVEALVKFLTAFEIDMTIFFRNLSKIDVTQPHTPADAKARERLAPLLEASYTKDDSTFAAQLGAWVDDWRQAVIAEGQDHAARVATMNQANPKYVLRNYLAQQAIDAATDGDVSVLSRLQRVLSAPYDEQPEEEDLFAKRPDWARNKVGCSMLSCSS